MSQAVYTNWLVVESLKALIGLRKPTDEIWEDDEVVRGKGNQFYKRVDALQCLLMAMRFEAAKDVELRSQIARLLPDELKLLEKEFDARPPDVPDDKPIPRFTAVPYSPRLTSGDSFTDCAADCLLLAINLAHYASSPPNDAAAFLPFASRLGKEALDCLTNPNAYHQLTDDRIAWGPLLTWNATEKLDEQKKRIDTYKPYNTYFTSVALIALRVAVEKSKAWKLDWFDATKVELAVQRGSR